MSPRKDRTGVRYGRLIVIKFADAIWDGRSFVTTWLCKCDCGNEKIIRGDSLQNGSTKSCGCFQRESASKLGKNRIGRKCSNYKDGKYCGKYTKAVRKLREGIRKRDNYTYQNCGITQEEHIKKFNETLSVHHIDGDDTNNINENMITLCRKCHRKTIKCW